jgi:hypothetical protein
MYTDLDHIRSYFEAQFDFQFVKNEEETFWTAIAN